ncbi:MAG: oligosaccharide flippase family protein [Gemmatimonadales bacterium]|nr:oligosaccharide flippase family protein [Gemmatimonadales bacterium]
MKRLWSSPTIRSAGVYGAAGVGFAAANLILARVLPPAEYALVTLVLALANLGLAMAPLGIDGVVNRRDLEAGPLLFRRVLLATTTIGLGFGLVAVLAYHTSATITAVIFLSTVVGGAQMVASAKFQSEQRFGLSLTLLQSPNLILLFAALVTVAAGVREAWPALVIMTLGWFPGAIWGWSILFRERHAKPHRSAEFPWHEALSFAGLQATGLLLVQLERLVLPHVLPLRDLATYGVLAAIAGSLFRVLQMSVGYTLVPRLRAASDVGQRRRLVAKETRLVGVVVLAGSVAIWLFTPVVERWFLGGKYHLAASLTIAAIVSGVAKVFNAFTRATASALATPRELSAVNLLGWVSLAIGLAGAIVGARWGLSGVIYGVTLGWLARSASALYVVAPHLRLPAAEPATAP